MSPECFWYVTLIRIHHAISILSWSSYPWNRYFQFWIAFCQQPSNEHKVNVMTQCNCWYGSRLINIHTVVCFPWCEDDTSKKAWRLRRSPILLDVEDDQISNLYRKTFSLITLNVKFVRANPMIFSIGTTLGLLFPLQITGWCSIPSLETETVHI